MEHSHLKKKLLMKKINLSIVQDIKEIKFIQKKNKEKNYMVTIEFGNIALFRFK